MQSNLWLNRLDLETRPERGREDTCARRYRDQLPGISAGDLLGHQPDPRDPAGKQNRAYDLRVAETRNTRKTPFGDDRHVVRHRTDHLRLPVAALRQK